jgi:hypothetical protein
MSAPDDRLNGLQERLEWLEEAWRTMVVKYRVAYPDLARRSPVLDALLRTTERHADEVRAVIDGRPL